MQEHLGYKTGVHESNWQLKWLISERPRMNGHIQLIQNFNTEPL